MLFTLLCCWNLILLNNRDFLRSLKSKYFAFSLLPYGGHRWWDPLGHNKGASTWSSSSVPYIIQSILTRFESVLLLPLQLNLRLNPIQMRFFSLLGFSCLMESDLNSYIQFLVFYVTYIILMYPVFVMYLNTASLISVANFLGGLSSNDVEK